MAIAAGRKALVIGGASGFGLAVARRLAEAGGGVAIADVSTARLERASKEDRRLVPLAFDASDARATREGVATAVRRLGGLDTLVYCAGVIHVKPLEDVAEEDWDRTLDVNLKGAFLVSQAAAGALKASGRGRIVAIASDAGRRGYPWSQAYVASKFGLVGLTQSLAAELAPHRVTVNCVCPSGCPTTGMGEDLTRWKMSLTGRSKYEVLASMAASFPLGRYIEESDVAAAVMYLLSEEAGFVTGASLDVDGGEGLGGFYPGAGPRAEAER
ncbi:MAG: SDR family NAD(P)-dependent oxidoreductase [Alphaproteobacteria bacterium]